MSGGSSSRSRFSSHASPQGHDEVDVPSGTVNLPLLGGLLLGSIPGIIIGSFATRRIPEAGLRIVLAMILMMVGVRMLLH